MPFNRGGWWRGKTKPKTRGGREELPPAAFTRNHHTFGLWCLKLHYLSSRHMCKSCKDCYNDGTDWKEEKSKHIKFLNQLAIDTGKQKIGLEGQRKRGVKS